MTVFQPKWRDWTPSPPAQPPQEAAQRPVPSPIGTCANNAFAWDAETAALIEWFQKTPPPAEPFELYQGVTVLRPDRFWEYLKGDIAGGPGMGRGRMGAFQKDLRRLAQLFGGPAPAGGTPDAP